MSIFQKRQWNYYSEYFQNNFNNLSSEIGIDNIKSFYTPYSDTQKENIRLNNILLEINEWKKNNDGGILPDIDIIPIKTSLNKKKIISLSLFNISYEKGKNYIENTNTRKTPSFYAKVLLEAFDTYKKYMSDWTIRLYIDESFTMDDDNPSEYKKIYDEFMKYENSEIYKVNIEYFKNKKKIHYSLIPVLFRYFILLDPDVETCFIGDIDNYCTLHLSNILNKFEKGSDKALIFMPHSSYKRPYNNKCMINFLAGMIGFKKQKSTIINPYFFISIFKSIDYFYKKNKNQKFDNCPIKLNYNSPFLYGFDEIAITCVLSLLFNKFSIDVNIIKMYFDFGLNLNDIIEIILVNNIFDGLTDDFKTILVDIFLLNTENNLNIFSNNTELLKLYNIENIPCYVILFHITYYFYYNNVNKINYNNKDIIVFNDKKIIEKNCSILPFIAGYTLNFNELKYNEENEKDIRYIYGNDCNKKINYFVELFTTYKYETLKNSIKEFKDKIKYDKTDSLIINQNLHFAIINSINKRIINDDINSINKHTDIKNNPIYKIIDTELSETYIYKNIYDYIVPFGESNLTTFLLEKYINSPYFIDTFNKQALGNPHLYSILNNKFSTFANMFNNKNNFINILNGNNNILLFQTIKYMERDNNYNYYYLYESFKYYLELDYFKDKNINGIFFVCQIIEHKNPEKINVIYNRKINTKSNILICEFNLHVYDNIKNYNKKICGILKFYKKIKK
jgi:hypothetical protein